MGRPSSDTLGSVLRDTARRGTVWRGHPHRLSPRRLHREDLARRHARWIMITALDSMSRIFVFDSGGGIFLRIGNRLANMV